jgi:hypothetical protein
MRPSNKRGDIDMKLVKNVADVWRHYSTGALLAVGALQGIWAATPQSWIDALPKSVSAGMAYVTMTVAVVGVMGKFIKQDLPSDKA